MCGEVACFLVDFRGICSPPLYSLRTVSVWEFGEVTSSSQLYHETNSSMSTAKRCVIIPSLRSSSGYVYTLVCLSVNLSVTLISHMVVHPFSLTSFFYCLSFPLVFLFACCPSSRSSVSHLCIYSRWSFWCSGLHYSLISSSRLKILNWYFV